MMRRLDPPHPRANGFTLVEAVIALVILAAAAAGILLIFAGPMAASADPQIRAQARALATSYMDEIVLRAFRDGDGDKACDASSRENYDTIWCYDDLNETPPKNQFGDEIGQLDDYTVEVSIGDDGDSATITVNVTHTSDLVDYDLVSNRGDY